MTDRMAALETLAKYDRPERTAALDDFYARYADDPLIIDKWLALQAAIPEPATLERVRALTAHPAFSMANPNRVRALIGSFAQANHTQFNRIDGAGYDFVADIVLALDPEESASGRAPDGRIPLLARARSGTPRARGSDAAAGRRGAGAVARRPRHRRAHAGGKLNGVRRLFPQLRPGTAIPTLNHRAAWPVGEPMMIDNPPGPKNRRRIKALLLSDRIDTSNLSTIDVLSTAPLTYKFGADGFVTLFRYGVAVLMGLTAAEESEVLRSLQPRLIRPVRPFEEETRADRDCLRQGRSNSSRRTDLTEDDHARALDRHRRRLVEERRAGPRRARSHRASSIWSSRLPGSWPNAAAPPPAAAPSSSTSATPCWCSTAFPAASRSPKSPTWSGIVPI